MSCGACVKGVTKVLSRLEGVQPKQVEVGSAEVAYDDARVSPVDIAAALAAAGYPARAKQ
jgi:copper chaperone CopZ